MNDPLPVDASAPPAAATAGATPGASLPLRILVADDEESMRHFVERGLRRLGHRVDAVGDGEAAVKAWRTAPYDLAVLDLKMPGVDGLQALQQIRSLDAEATVLLMTAHGTIATAVSAMQGGAADFVTKPFPIEELQLRLERAAEQRRMARENRNLRALLEPADGGAGLAAKSPAMRELLRQIELVRDATATVLLTGESGTGKGVVAKALHLGSARRNQPFVAMNCAAVPDTLVESELFGHEPGAFTGARTRRTGLLWRAHRGTLLLDEIADMSPAAQAKIEHFLQEREFLPLGATEPVRVDVRIVAATNRDLHALAADGRFRPELLWRLDVVSLRVPALRERREDVPVLVEQNLRRLPTSDGTARTVSAEALAALSVYDWPGNVRELENVVQRMAVLAGARAELGIDDLPPALRGPAGSDATGGNDYEAARRRFDQAYFAALLHRCGGCITDAAQHAGISRGHLHRRLKELDLDANEARAARSSELRDDDL